MIYTHIDYGEGEKPFRMSQSEYIRDWIEYTHDWILGSSITFWITVRYGRTCVRKPDVLRFVA